MKKLKNGFLRGALALAFCFCLTLSTFNGVTFVKAADHTHAFTDGKCSCGSMKIEAESGTLTGTSHYTWVTTTMIETDGTASGGACIGCFDVTGNTATWKFNLEKAVTDVDVSFSMKSFIETSDMSGFKLTVNGSDLDWKEGERLKNTSSAAEAYVLYTSGKFSAAKGELSVKLEIVNAATATANIDYLILNLVDSVQEEIIDPREDDYAVKVEAEDANINGTSQNPSQSSDMIVDKEGASNGQEVGFFGVDGNTAEWYFDFESAAENVRVFFYVRSSGDYPTDGFGIYVDDVKIEWGSASFTNTAGLATPYRMYYSKTFSVAKGEHVVKLKVLDSSSDKCSVNFDYVMLSGYGNVKVKPIVTDRKAPTVTNIAVSGTEINTEWKVSFDVSDNVTKLEDIVTSVKLYRNYEDPEEEEVTITDGKFTPTKNGVYTIVIKATDEASNVAEIKQSFRIGSELDGIDDPRNDSNAAKIEAEDGDISGTSQYPGVTETMIENNEKASGGKEIGCFAVNGNKVEWTFDFESDADNVRVFFYARSFVDGPTDGFGIYVDDTQINWHSTTFDNTASEALNPYRLYCSKTFSVKAGKHVVRLEVLDNADDKCAVNFDYVMLAGYGDVKVSPVLPDSEPPVIGDITIGTPELNKEVSVTFDVSDNESKKENINTLIRVWIDYRGDNEEEIDVVDGKFTPTKNGEYTVLVRAIDENGNVSDKTYSFRIGPVDDGDWSVNIKKDLPSWLIGLIIVACALVVAGVLTAFELYRRKNNQ